MAPKLNLRPSMASATLIAFIAVLAMLVMLAAPVSACDCSYGVISYNGGAKCWYGGPATGSYKIIPYNGRYNIYCQRTGKSVNGNNWWNRVYYKGGYCYVNDYYMKTGCPTRCNNLALCH